ncbi:MAG TPA: DUF4340 domain-containing protein, partial [Xanthobacteraceae bacterium]|nr:DUF4340 domain-containing protein [Xanthobacteraceae bacterium]
MNTRQFGILAVIAALSVGATALALRTGTRTIASDRRGEQVVPGLLDKANGLTGLVVRQGNDPITIEKRGSGFAVAEIGFPVKTDLVRDLVTGLIELRFEEARTSDPARLSELGLADAGSPGGGKEVTLRSGSGEIANVIIGIGDSTVGSSIGGVYVRLKGAPQTWLARGNVRLPPTRADWFAAVDLGAKRFEIKKIELSGGDKDAVSVAPVADKPGELTLENVPEGRFAETFKVSRLPTFVESFSFLDVRKRTVPAANTRRMTVEVDGGLRLVFASVGDLSEGWVQVSAEATADAKREKATSISSSVDAYEFRIPANQAETLGLTMADLTTDQKPEP